MIAKMRLAKKRKKREKRREDSKSVGEAHL
jgi:hypothetical protein